MYLPARQTPLSMIFWPSTMAEHAQFPMHCARKNMMIQKGRDSKDKTRNTPYDLYMSMNPMGDQALYGADGVRVEGKGCLGVGAGPYIPPANFALTPYHTNAAALGVIKSIKLGRKTAEFLGKTTSMIGNRFPNFNFWGNGWSEGDNPYYDFRLKNEKKNAYADKVQWVRNDRMPEGCNRLEQHQSFYGDANLRQQDDKSLTGIHWRFFRCCSKGYKRKPPSILRLLNKIAKVLTGGITLPLPDPWTELEEPFPTADHEHRY